jgi:hypothetical protein
MNLQNPIFPTYIYDKHGSPYYVDIVFQTPKSFCAYICGEHLEVGRINWVLKDNIMNLADIIIFDPPLLQTPMWCRLVPFYKWRPPSFRKRGLGSAMLKYVILQAVMLRVNAINGYIIYENWFNTPYLSLFYKRHGFVIQKTETVHGNNITIYREIESGEAD